MAANFGPHQLGDVVSLRLQCRDSGGRVTSPATPPVASVYGPTGTVIDRVKMSADLQGAVLGSFRLPLLLDEDYGTEGMHTVLFQWTTTTGSPGAALASFLLVGGGNADGAVTSLYPYRRSEATYLMRVTEAGDVIRGRNPR